MIRGVNLGGWLVLEKWITPALFAGTSAEDEAHLWTELSDRGQRELLRGHRDSFITERDFADLASRRIDAVRIPVPYFVLAITSPTAAASITLTAPSPGLSVTESRCSSTCTRCRTARTASTAAACAASANGTALSGFCQC